MTEYEQNLIKKLEEDLKEEKYTTEDLKERLNDARKKISFLEKSNVILYETHRFMLEQVMEEL